MSGHTELPWTVEGDGSRSLIRGADLTIVAIRYRLPAEIHQTNFELIVTACNSHAELVKALENLDAVLDFNDENLEPVWTFDDLTAVRAAFKQATAALATLTARKVGVSHG